jgi:O-antigen/teichoic acid export membrane protein
MAVQMWLTVLTAVFTNVLAANDRFDLIQGIGLVLLGLRALLTVVVLELGFGLAGLVGVVAGVAGLALVTHVVAARRILPGIRIWPLTICRDRLKELLGYGIWAAIAANAHRIVGQTDLIIVGALIGISPVTVYSVGAMLVYYSDTILGKISVTFFPPVQRAAGRGDAESVRWYYLRQLRLAVALGIPMYLGYVIFGERFIGLWMRHPVEFPETSVAGAAAVMTVLSVRKLLYLPAYGGEPLLAAVGRVRFSSLMGITEAAINLGLSIVFVLVLDWGILGVAAGTLVACILVRGWVIPWRAVREAGLRPEAFLKVLGLGVLAAGGFAAWGLFLRTVIVHESWAMFWVQVGLALAGYAPMAFYLLVPPADRKRVFRALRPGARGANQAEPGEVELPD